MLVLNGPLSRNPQLHFWMIHGWTICPLNVGVPLELAKKVKKGKRKKKGYIYWINDCIILSYIYYHNNNNNNNNNNVG